MGNLMRNFVFFVSVLILVFSTALFAQDELLSSQPEEAGEFCRSPERSSANIVISGRKQERKPHDLFWKLTRWNTSSINGRPNH